MKKLTFLVLWLLVIGIYIVNAQQRTITGTVTSSEDGSSLVGVSVLVKGTSNGTITDIDGKYSFSVPSTTDTLVFSFIGMTSQNVVINNRAIIDVILNPETIGVDEVVVTAFGISKQKKALGYSVSKVNSEQLEQKPETDIARVLSGKAAGVKVTSTSGVSGSGTNITIRGYSSIKGNNQPLFIVDGVRFSGSTNSGTDNEQGFTEGNQSTSSRFLDIDPNNIESISVLKGLSATTVYGSEGRNGVIIITTKGLAKQNFNKKMEVAVNQSFFVNKVNLPEFQHSYGNGFQQQNGFFYSNWGAKITNPPEEVAHPYTQFNNPELVAAFPEYQDATYQLKSYDNVEAFFNTGTISNTSININGGGKEATYSANVSYVNDQGFLPNNQLTKFNMGIGGSAKLANKLVYSGTMNFVKTDMKTPPISYGSGSGIGNGSGISVFADVLYTPRTVDLMDLPFENPLDHSSIYYRRANDIQNPRWTAKYAKSVDNVNRLFGAGNLSYGLMEGLKLSYKYGIDFYAENQEYQLNKGSVQNDNYINGLYRSRSIFNTIWDQTVMLNYNKDLSESIGVDFLLGGNSVREIYSADGMESTNQLVFGFMNHKNFSDHSTINSFNDLAIQRREESNTLGLFGQATIDYNNYLFLNMAARNDWFSSLQPANRSQFYPSTSISFLPSELFEILKTDYYFDLLKIRLGYGTSAGFPPLYVTENILEADARAHVASDGSIVPSNSVSYFLGNPNLTPELHAETEFGLEFNMFKNRLGADFTVYSKQTKDLITNASLDPATGYSETYVNIGKMSNKGIELELHGTPVRIGDFDWALSFIFTKYESVIDELGAGLDKVLINGWTNLGNYAIEGEPYGVMYGDKIKRDDQGRRLVDGNGNYLHSDEPDVIGNPHPDFELSWINTLKYKGFAFNMQWDYRKGGDIFSETVNTLLGRGITKDTDFDRSQTFVMPGYLEDGTPNDIQITATNAYFNNFGSQAPSEVNVIDGTTIRLREISLSYSMPSKWLEKTPFGKVDFALVGQNIWFKAVNFPEHMNFDTDMLSLGVGNGLGFDFITGPSSTKYGASLKVTF